MADLRNFFLQLETSLASGIPIVRSLNLMSANISGWGMKGKVGRMAKSIDNGSTFSEALAAAGRPFNKMHVSFIRFGEETGCLDKVCASLAAHAEREVGIERKVIQALIYPGFILTVAMLMGPILGAISKQQSWSAGLIPGLIQMGCLLGGVMLFYLFYAFIGRGFIDSVLYYVPLVGMIFQRYSLSRFTRALSVGLFAGVPMTDALKTAIDVSDNPWLMNQLKGLPKHVGSGKGLASGMENAGCLPGTLKEMIVVGEQSGRLPEMLEKTANYFEDEATHRLDMIMKILPAVIFLLVAAYVGFMVYTSFGKVMDASGLSLR